MSFVAGAVSLNLLNFLSMAMWLGTQAEAAAFGLGSSVSIGGISGTGT